MLVDHSWGSGYLIRRLDIVLSDELKRRYKLYLRFLMRVADITKRVPDDSMPHLLNREPWVAPHHFT